MQRLIPVRNPSIPLSGLIVLLAVIFLSLNRGAGRRARSYLAGLAALAVTLLTMILARVAPTTLMAGFWQHCARASLYALSPAWLSLALAAFGARRESPRKRTALLSASALSWAIGLLALTNPLHGLYWSDYGFQGRAFIAAPTIAATIGEGYRYALSACGLAALIASAFRHRGRERARAAFLGTAFALVVTGDALWAFDVALPIGMNPLTLLSTLAAYIIGLAYARHGLPDEPPVVEPDRPAARAGGDALAEAGLSERQRAIALAVAAGQAYKAIAAREGIAERTVKYHMAQILDKLGLETREQLIAFVALQGSPKG